MRLIAYNGFLENKKILISGRLTYGKFRKPKSNDTYIQNIIDLIRQYYAIGIPQQKVKIHIGTQTKIIRTNNRGDYKTHINYEKKDMKNYTVQYKDEQRCAKIFLPENKKLAIITDVDDTFLVSHSTSFFKRIWTSAINNFNTRNSVKDIIDIYKTFSGPVFYVSNSQWKLYEVIDGFRKINNMPPGPFLLRGRRKYTRIKAIIESYPYKFILIGDDGHKDPEVYTRINKEFPNKIKAICIRQISSRKRLDEVQKKLPKTKSFISHNGKKCLMFVKEKIAQHTTKTK